MDAGRSDNRECEIPGAGRNLLQADPSRQVQDQNLCSGLFPRGALLRFAFGRKNMTQHIFPFESELQNNLPEVARSSPSLSPTVSEKLALYGSTALSGVEHLTLLVGNEEIASTLIRHFGSMKALSHPSLLQIRQFLPHRKAEAVVAAFSVSGIAESKHARSEVFDNPESVYRACAEMKLLNQEVLRIVLLDAKRRLISIVDIRKGTLNESLAYPREIFRTVILNAAYAFVLVHNLWVATHSAEYF
jgi:DNA repair protein RadC